MSSLMLLSTVLSFRKLYVTKESLFILKKGVTGLISSKALLNKSASVRRVSNCHKNSAQIAFLIVKPAYDPKFHTDSR